MKMSIKTGLVVVMLFFTFSTTEACDNARSDGELDHFLLTTDALDSHNCLLCAANQTNKAIKQACSKLGHPYQRPTINPACYFDIVPEELLQIYFEGEEITTRDNAGNMPLHDAARRGDLAEVRYLAKVFCNLAKAPYFLYRANFNGDTPLHLAAQNGHLAVVKLLVAIIIHLEQREYLNTEDKAGFTPLHGAIAMGHSDIVKFLVKTLQHNTAIEPYNSLGFTLMHTAALNDDPSIIAFLHEVAYIPLNLPDSKGNMPLQWAEAFGNSVMIKYLVSTINF